MEKIGTIARAYYDFFANFVGDGDTEVTFFENGWFLIANDDPDEEKYFVFKIYDDEAKLRRLIKVERSGDWNWQALCTANLFVMLDGNNDTLVVYHRDTIIKEFKIKNLFSYRIESVDDCALYLISDEELYVLNVKATYGPYLRLGYEDKTEVKLIQLDRTDKVLSADGLGLVACQNSKGKAYILDMNGQKLHDDYNCDEIKFLYGFKALLIDNFNSVHMLDYKNRTDTCTSFDGEIFLMNYHMNGIKPVCGRSVVEIQNVLFAGANGDLLEECKAFPDIRFADYTPDVEGGDKPVFVEDFVVHYQGKKGFLPIDCGPCAKVLGEMLLVVTNVEKYYPIFPRFAGYKTWEDKEHYYYNKVFKQASVM